MAEHLTPRVAAEVRAEMGRQRATQREIGLILGISQPQVSKRLLAEHPFNTRELDKLADAWGVPVERFLPAGQPASLAS